MSINSDTPPFRGQDLCLFSASPIFHQKRMRKVTFCVILEAGSWQVMHLLHCFLEHWPSEPSGAVKKLDSPETTMVWRDKWPREAACRCCRWCSWFIHHPCPGAQRWGTEPADEPSCDCCVVLAILGMIQAILAVSCVNSWSTESVGISQWFLF